MLFSDVVSPTQFVGYVISLLFFCVYNFLQLRPGACGELRRAPKKQGGPNPKDPEPAAQLAALPAALGPELAS